MTLPRIHAFRGKLQLLGQYVHIEFLLLALVEVSMLLLLLDSLLVEGQFFAALVTANGFNSQPLQEIMAYSIGILGCMVCLGLYDANQRVTIKSGLWHVAMTAVAALVVISTVSWLMPGWQLGISIWQSRQWLMLLCAILGCLFFTRFIFHRYIDGNTLIRRVLVLGTGERASAIARLKRQSDRRGFKLLGFIEHAELVQQTNHSSYFQKGYDNFCHSHQSYKSSCIPQDHQLKVNTSLSTYAIDNRIDELVLAIDDRRCGLPTDELLNCRMSGIDVIDDLDFLEREAGILPLEIIQPSWLIHARGFCRNRIQALTKRCFDVIFSLLLLLLLSPLALLTTLALLLETRGKGPVLFKQLRVGQGGRCFCLYKYRSMRVDAEADGRARWATKDDPRVTRVGAIIRKYRLDEIPQLWNVLRGDMSLVGPRPERPEFVKDLCRYHPLYSERHRLPPGVTGWAQIYFPYGASAKDAIEKLKYDLYYLKHQNIFMDLYIVMKTVEVVLFKVGSR